MAHHICPWWLAYTFDNPFRNFFHKTDHILKDYVRKGMTVVDIGCGMGHFSIGMARMVGASGRVIAVDVQPRMLAKVNKRASRAGLSRLVHTHLCNDDRIDLSVQMDFSLAFWMVHETPDIKHFFHQTRNMLSSTGQLLVTEPRFHISQDKFEQELQLAQAEGFQIADRPAIAFSRSALLSPG